MTIKQKLLGFAALSICLMLVISMTGFFGLNQLSNATNSMGTNSTILSNHLTADMMHDALSSDVLATLVASETDDQEALNSARNDLEEHANTFNESLNNNLELITQTDIRAALQQVTPTLQTYIETARQIADLAGSDRPSALASLPEFRAAYEDLAVRMGSLTALIEENTAEVEASAHQAAQQSNTFMAVVTVVGLLILIVIAWMLSNQIGRALHQLIIGARAVADGDLRHEINVRGKDEIAQTSQALESMRNKLATMVSAIASAANRLADASATLKTVASETRDSIQHQQSEISQVAAAMHEMTASAQEVSNNINQAAAAATQAKQSGDAGIEVVEAAISEMQRLAGQIEETAAVILRLNDDSGEISDILSVITGVAEQTNLLALNAAIEAARAGEQGRGFAVVADEVRTLAGRTQASTQQIQETTEKLQGGSQSAVGAMEKSQKQATVAVERARKAGESLRSIALSVTDINDMNTQIASASEEQSSVSESISHSLEDIDSKTQQTTKGVEKTSSAALDVAAIAGELQTAVAQFQT